MDKAEAKFTNTAKKMNDALVALLRDRTFDSITVTDVCKAAGVHRSTFYSHYDTTRDLLAEVRDRYIDVFSQELERSPISTEPQSKEYLKSFLRFTEMHKDLFRVFAENGVLFPRFEIHTGHTACAEDRPWELALHDGRLSEYRSVFKRAGIARMIEHWIKSGFNGSCAEFADLIFEVTNDFSN